MYTIETVINQLTSKEIVLKKISNTLRRIDPSFPEEEQHYLQAVNANIKVSHLAGVRS